MSRQTNQKYKTRNQNKHMNQNNYMSFTKMNGAGNKIIVADMGNQTKPFTTEIAEMLAKNTKFDQIMSVKINDEAGGDADIHIFNYDGSIAEACGNGMRCVTMWMNKKTKKNQFVFNTPSGTQKTIINNDGTISVNMGKPKFKWDEIPLSEQVDDTTKIELTVNDEINSPAVVNIGNPHAVFWVPNNPEEYELDKFGPELECHSMFPQRANITIAQVVKDDTIKIRTWERGAGLTQACGSAACATAICSHKINNTKKDVTIVVPGGVVSVRQEEDDSLVLTGTAETEYEASLDLQNGTIKKHENLI